MESEEEVWVEAAPMASSEFDCEWVRVSLQWKMLMRCSLTGLICGCGRSEVQPALAELDEGVGPDVA